MPLMRAIGTVRASIAKSVLVNANANVNASWNASSVVNTSSIYCLQACTRAMSTKYNIPSAFDPADKTGKHDKLLFTPGPLTTSYLVKQAMLTDLGSRDHAFIRVIKEVREGLLAAANVSTAEYTTIPIQGSGTFGVESVLSTIVPKNPKEGSVLIIANGAYGDRMVTIAKVHKLPHQSVQFNDYELPNKDKIEDLLKNSDVPITHVAMVHSETTSGIINNIEEIGQLCKKYNKSFIVDAMSSFGGVPIDFRASNIDYLVSSANKCIEGVPGFSFIIARKAAIPSSYTPTTLTLDFIGQAKGFDKDGQFRFTPPTHSLLAFRQALREFEAEGGVAKRHARYLENQKVLMKGMDQLGFELYLEPKVQGCIISSYRYPSDKNWSFEKFYTELNNLNLVIYPGKVSKADCFRIGHIGRLFPEDTQTLVNAIEKVCKEMKTARFYKERV